MNISKFTNLWVLKMALIYVALNVQYLVKINYPLSSNYFKARVDNESIVMYQNNDRKITMLQVFLCFGYFRSALSKFTTEQ